MLRLVFFACILLVGWMPSVTSAPGGRQNSRLNTQRGTYPGNNCPNNRCQNGGTCVFRPVIIRRYLCRCSPGFTGNYCEVNIDDCPKSPTCQNGGTCVDGVNSYTCQCAEPYTGVFCEDYVVECQEALTSYCLNGGTCRNRTGTIGCVCAPGYGGDRCQIIIDDCTSDTCLNGGTCIDGIEAFSCVCPLPYEGIYCQYLTACASSPCHASATCEKDPVTQEARCFCPSGRTGNDCSADIDECQFDPCTSGRCINTDGGYYCQCAPGYTGVFCDVHVDACISDPCLNRGICLINDDQYLSCVCADGYTGALCEIDTDECASHPCLNDSLCTDGVNGYTCTCRDGWTGQDCDVDITSTSCPVCVERMPHNWEMEFGHSAHAMTARFRSNRIKLLNDYRHGRESIDTVVEYVMDDRCDCRLEEKKKYIILAASSIVDLDSRELTINGSMLIVPSKGKYIRKMEAVNCPVDISS